MKTNKNTNNKKDPELLKQIQQLCLMDDTFMTIFFDGQNDLMEFVLKIILNTQDLKVLQTKTQIDIHSIAERSNYLKYLKGATKMGDSFEKFVQKRIKEAIKENNAETKRNFAINLLKITELSESVIAASADLSLSEVKKLSKKIRKTKIAN